MDKLGKETFLIVLVFLILIFFHVAIFVSLSCLLTLNFQSDSMQRRVLLLTWLFRSVGRSLYALYILNINLIWENTLFQCTYRCLVTVAYHASESRTNQYKMRLSSSIMERQSSLHPFFGLWDYSDSFVLKNLVQNGNQNKYNVFHSLQVVCIKALVFTFPEPSRTMFFFNPHGTQKLRLLLFVRSSIYFGIYSPDHPKYFSNIPNTNYSQKRLTSYHV